MTELITSSEPMKRAVNYNNWTFDLFKNYIKGDILEVGCGMGNFTKIFAENNNFNSLLSIDISQEAINYTKNFISSPKIRIENTDLLDINEKFDLIVCMNVLEHINNHEEFFNKMFSLLNKNGILFLLVPSHNFLFSNFDKADGHYRRYSKKTLNHIKVSDENIQLINQYYFNPLGAMGYYIVYKIFKKIPVSDLKNELGFFDKIVVPISKKIFPKSAPFGISLISVYKKI